MRFVLIALFALGTATASAGDGKYPVISIPFQLLKKANVVKRMEEKEFRLISKTEAVLRHKFAITILNEKGEEHAGLVRFYDKFHTISSIEGALYDAAGNQLRKVKGREIGDYSAVDDNTMMGDGRRKEHHFQHSTYPYTVEYEVEERFTHTFWLPYWVPVEDVLYAVQSSVFTVSGPSDYVIRHKAYNYEGQPQVTTEKGITTIQWKVANLPAVQYPYASPQWKELTTMVMTAPSEFSIDGYKGSMNTWKEFGLFLKTLTDGRDALPAEVQEKVKELTANLTDDREKVRVLYEFLQKNTRYISIQLGIGGWQPFEAAFVAKKGYGDCKALTNYMFSLLKAAGIRSIYTAVYAGNRPVMLEDDFPANQFNHVILCVPQPIDTIWLECTSQILPAGYMSAFTGNRKALLITEEGGVVVSTPRYGLKENIQLRAVKAAIDLEGNLTMQIKTRYGGTQQDDVSELINVLSKEKVRQELQEQFSLATYEVNQFDYKEVKGVLPEVHETLDITVRNYATVTGKRLFLVPNLLNRGGMEMKIDSTRKVDYVFRSAYHDEDKIEFEIPEGYELESAPGNTDLKTRFGAYRMHVKLIGNKIIYERINEQYEGRFPASAGKELADFLGAIYKADRVKLVLVKKAAN
jgi:transglutaminase-like putative cysteine protease